MKVNMKIKMRKWAAALLCGSMVFTAVACGNGGGQGKDTAMGRYVEKILELPGEAEGLSTSFMLARPDHSLELYQFNLETDTLVRQYGQDGEKWEMEALDWKFAKGEDLAGVACDSQGRRYLYTLVTEEDTIQSAAYREADDGSLEKLEIRWQVHPRLGSTMVQRMGVLENGDLIFSQRGMGILQYGPDGNFKRNIGDTELDQFAVNGNEINALNFSAGGMTVYDGETGEELRTVSFEGMNEDTQIGAGAEGAVYLVNQSGIYRLVAGGDVWEKLLDGDLTSLSIPSLYFYHFVEGQDQDFYMLMVDDEEVNLVRYRYDKNIASQPEKELVVYSLYENKTVRQAAGQFQRKNPDTKVNIQVAMGDDGATEADLIRTLNTELLQGKGPDVIILDGLPVESYGEKGVLADLSDTVKQADKKGKLVDSVVRAYQTKKGLWAVPTRFSVSVLVTDEETAKSMTNLKAAADFAESHPDKGLFGNRDPKRLLEMFLPACAPAWLNGAQIDEEGLTEFLTQLKRIAEVPAQNYQLPVQGAEMKSGTFNVGSGSGGVSIHSTDEVNKELDTADLFHWTFGRAYAAVKPMSGMGNLSGVSIAMEKKGGGTMGFLPGQVDNVFKPQGVVGVNASSKQLESAKDFVAAMLSDSVQGVELFNGFPVSEKALSRMSKTGDETIYMSFGNPYDENEELEGGMPPDEQGAALMELVLQAKTPAMTDQELANLISTQALGYFTGEKDVERTVLDIKEKTKLYLSE